MKSPLAFKLMQLDADIGTMLEVNILGPYFVSLNVLYGLNSSSSSASMTTSEQGLSLPFLISEPFLHFMFRFFE